MSGVINVWCGECLVWSMSGVFNVLFYTQCDQCLVWSMSGVVNVLFYTRCDQCLVWSMSGVVNVWCDQCLVWSMSYFTNGVINVWCDQCLVWSMSVWSMSYNLRPCNPLPASQHARRWNIIGPLCTTVTRQSPADRAPVHQTVQSTNLSPTWFKQLVNSDFNVQKRDTALKVCTEIK